MKNRCAALFNLPQNVKKTDVLQSGDTSGSPVWRKKGGREGSDDEEADGYHFAFHIIEEMILISDGRVCGGLTVRYGVFTYGVFTPYTD